MQKSQKSPARKLALIGILSAMVFVLSMVSIPIGDISRIHLGNIMCLISGIVFGPLTGGLAAGLGSMMYDFTNPLYAPEFWITFLTKFSMGFIAGLIYKVLPQKTPSFFRYLGAAVAGQATYIFLYFVKSFIMQYYVIQLPLDAVWPLVMAKVAISALNGVIAVAASVVFAPALRAALNSAGLFISRKKGRPTGKTM